MADGVIEAEVFRCIRAAAFIPEACGSCRGFFGVGEEQRKFMANEEFAKSRQINELKKRAGVEVELGRPERHGRV